MAFNAGAIEATLTLNRNPFTAGLKAAQRQARALRDVNVTVNLRLGQTTRQLEALQKRLNRVSGSYVARARVNIDDRAFRAMERRLQGFNNRVYTATARVINQTVNEAERRVRQATRPTTTTNTVNTDVKVNTSAADTQIKNFKSQAQRSIWIPLIVDPSQATDATERLRLQLQNLKNSAIVSPRFEERQFIDQYGRIRTRLVKVSRDHGTFAGEAFSSRMIRSIVNKKYGMFLAPIFTAIGAGFSAAAVAATSVAFAAIAFNAQSKFGDVKIAVDNAKASLDNLINTSTTPLADNFVGVMGQIRAATENAWAEMFTIFYDLQSQVNRAGQSIGVIANTVLPALANAVAVSGPAIDGLFDSIESIGEGVSRFLSAIMTAAPQAGQTFRTLGVVIADIAEMVGFLGAAVLNLFGGQIWNEFEATFESLTNIIERFVTGALPAFGQGFQIALNVLNTMLNVIEPIAGILGTWVGTFAGIAIVVRAFSTSIGIAVAAISMLTGAIAKAAISKFALQLGNAGLAASAFVQRTTGMTAAANGIATGTSKAVTALDKLGKSLPFIGAGLVAVGIAYENMKSKADEAATGVLNGSMTMQEAINQERNQIEKRTLAHAFWLPQAMQEKKIQDANAEASRNVRDAMREQLAQMNPLEQAQAKLALAQGHYNDMVVKFGVTAPETIAAQSGIAFAAKELERAETNAARATETHTDAILRQRDEILAAIDSGFAYRNALNNLEDAQKASAEAVKQHGGASEEASRAFLAEEEAAMRVAQAAAQKAYDTNIAKGEDVAAEAATRALIAELERQAATATGPVKDALLGYISDLRGASGAAAGAEGAARSHKDELGRLATTANGPVAAAIRAAMDNFDSLGGAHASAETRASLQTEQLLALARMADGQTRQSLINLAGAINGLPNGKFTVTAEGKVTYDTARSLLNNPGPNNYGQGYTGGIIGRGSLKSAFAGGGVLPGYTPGKDVHRFLSPTGGTLDLSGGEAVMRPEWTRVMGSKFIHNANKAARSGGIRGVMNFMRQEHPWAYQDGGVLPRQKFAMGGTINMTGMQPFKNTAHHQYDVATEAYEKWVVPKLMAKLKAMATAMMGTASGGGGWQWQMSVLRRVFPGLQLISGYRPGAITATGNPSYHGKGRAVDVPPRMDVFNWIKGTYGANTKELIFSPAGAGQVHNGRPHMYTGVTRANHWDHVHWAYKRGGILPNVQKYDQGGVLKPGATLALNNTGKNEFVNTREQLEGLGTKDVAAKLDALIELLGRKGAGANITVQGQSADPVETARATVLALRL